MCVFAPGFAQSRNVSLQHAHGVSTAPFILILDADEHLDAYNLDLLRRTLEPPAAAGVEEPSSMHPGMAAEGGSPLPDCDLLPLADPALAAADSPPRLPPVCLNFRIACVDGHGEPVRRSSSGLLNPRVFPNSSRYAFVNQVGLRFERVCWDGEDIPAEQLTRSGITFVHAIPHVGERVRKNRRYHALDATSGAEPRAIMADPP